MFRIIIRIICHFLQRRLVVCICEVSSCKVAQCTLTDIYEIYETWAPSIGTLLRCNINVEFALVNSNEPRWMNKIPSKLEVAPPLKCGLGEWVIPLRLLRLLEHLAVLINYWCSTPVFYYFSSQLHVLQLCSDTFIWKKASEFFSQPVFWLPNFLWSPAHVRRVRWL